MEKNWLIRTKSNHILGPISKEKVLELYQNGSVKPDDEICSGNGFWFYIREEDMVMRFIMGNEVQGFNPISEAKDVLTHSGREETPDEMKSDDITLVGGINLSLLKDPVNPVEVKVQNSPEIEHKEEGPKGPQKKNNLVAKKIQSKNSPAPVKKFKQQSYLKYFGIIGLLLLFLLVYFRKTIIRSLFHGEITNISFSLFNVAHAQEDLPSKKKSS